MQTKSNIQLIREACEYASNYKDALNNLMDKFTIEDSVFVCKNGKVYEATQGYFELVAEYDNLNEAIKSCWGKFDTMGVRIEDNKKFSVGNIHKFINECSEDSKVFCISNFQSIR
jgi:hypothetical protein